MGERESERAKGYRTREQSTAAGPVLKQHSPTCVNRVHLYAESVQPHTHTHTHTHTPRDREGREGRRERKNVKGGENSHTQPWVLQFKPLGGPH